ncbi:nitrogen permease regulating protein NPR2 LALA0_S08e01068g [Lachancea lanzarotensis]|uniref:LALA0S08e01068g1_1 n=1 Tax=Lachancea lanzarotensis TaxID=1245769 RepID=A0A0C7MZX7_9SACH|nr:uncharacterized protein LALA0_S08e01068g [Lachancea lanzarotensis]CEP63379.1 LALA0S08e01068g1_1 [Lachancea lanzarotensis]
MPNSWGEFAPATGVFYSVFHPTEGTKVKYEFPPGCLADSDINFSTIKNYVIPKPQLCNKLLTFKCGTSRLVCYPVNVAAPYYARNSFSFDFVFIFPYDCVTSPYEPSIERLGKMFTVLEEQSQILSKAENSSVFFQLKAGEALQRSKQEPATGTTEKSSVLGMGVDGNEPRDQDYAFEKYQEILKDLDGPGKRLAVDDLITKIFQDLNNYSECLIPIDSGNAVDIKLFPLLAPPTSNLSFEDVPISTVNLARLIDASWDPTMLRIVPYINGINSISKISRLSDSDVGLVTECIKHFIYYNCVILADIFQFSNIYAPTSTLGSFLTDPSLATACQSYVTFKDNSHIPHLPFGRRAARLSSSNSRSNNASETFENLRKGRLYTSKSESVSSAIDFSVNAHHSTPPSHDSSVPYPSGDALHSYPINKSLKENDVLFPSKSFLFDLYRSLIQGQSISEWYKIHSEKIRAARIDVRRFITFGTVHGLLYRCSSFPIMRNAGFFDALGPLDQRLGTNLASSDWLPLKGGLNNLLSAADIKVGLSNDTPRKTRNRFANTDAAEEALNDVYRKLAIKDTSEPSVKNPMSTFCFGERSRSSLDKSTKGSFSPAGSDTLSRDASEIRRPATPASYDERKRNDMYQSIVARRNEELILLKAVRDVDSFDKLCSRLEKGREEIEEMLRDLGPYNVVNT